MKTVQINLHGFGDATKFAYGANVYVVCIQEDGSIRCSLALCKSKVAPLNQSTSGIHGSVPRLELTAACVMTELMEFASSQLEVTISEMHYWTDSLAVYYQINNPTLRPPEFVANRLSKIQRCSKVNDWKYVPSKLNPADPTSRGIKVDDDEAIRLLHCGPEFILQDPSLWPTISDAQLKEASVICATEFSLPEKKKGDKEVSLVSKLAEKYSVWPKFVRHIAILMRFVQFKTEQFKGEVKTKGPISVHDMKVAENLIFRDRDNILRKSLNYLQIKMQI